MSNVVFFHLFNDRSGSPKVLADVIAHCLADGLDCQLITSNHPEGFLSPFSGITRPLFYRRGNSKVLTLFYYLITQIHMMYLCIRYCRGNDVFYVNTMMPAAAGLAGMRLGKRVIFHVHETSLRPALLKLVLRNIINLTADRVIYVSNYLRGVEPFTRPVLDVVYNSVSVPNVDVVIDKSPLVGTFNVLMACSLKEYKGVYEFLALARTFELEPEYQFNLVLNACSDEIDAELAGALPSNVNVYPRQSNLSEFYQNASVVLNLSRPDGWVETFGLTILEAMSFGLPVIVPTVGGPAELVQDGVNGFLVSCYDIDTLHTRIVQLRVDPILYKRIAASALSRSTDFGDSVFRDNILKNIYACVL